MSKQVQKNKIKPVQEPLNVGQVNKFVKVFRLKDLHKNDRGEWVAYDDIDGEQLPVIITPQKYWAAWDEGDLAR